MPCPYPNEVEAGKRDNVRDGASKGWPFTAQLYLHCQEAPDPLSPYAATKLAAEQASQLYSRLYRLETVALRFFNVYGPRQDPVSPYAAVVPRFITMLQHGQQPTIYGDGGQSRDFIFVGDIVRALWIGATAANIAGQVFNVGRGEMHSILDLAHMIGGLLGVAVLPRFDTARAGEVRRSCADVSKFTAQAGFKAQMRLQDGVAAIIMDRGA